MGQTLIVTADPKLSLDEAVGMLRALNALGRQSEPPFGVAVAGDRESDGGALERVYFTVASHPSAAMPAAIEQIARAVLGILSERGGPGHIQFSETVVRVAPGATPVEIAALARQLAEAVSADSLTPPHAPDWPDPEQDAEAFHRFVQTLSGLTVEGIVQTARMNDTDLYSARCPGGELFLVPEGDGWTLAFTPTGGPSPTRVWSTVPTPQALALGLNLDGYLNVAPPGVQPEFRCIEFNPEAKAERKHFATTIGPVVVHTRQQSAEAPVEMVIEVKDQGRIFTLGARKLHVGTSGDFDRIELPELPF